MSLSPESGVRKQDGYKVELEMDENFEILLSLHKVLGGVGRNTLGRYLAWDFIRDRWSDLKK